ncbi:pyridoxamine 5'-phosphate oxidase family protein [Luteococcus sp. H138]|uniref:pyridoxamine 5'-phosphate oxidase family protein n=1 Tax=unclassified Luteococcus TaxID=2639923 RepID=UPI00313D4CF7
MTTQADHVSKVRDIADSARFAMLTTKDATGALVSRPMTVQEIGDDFTVLFITQRETDVAQQADGSQVNLAFQDGMDFVSIAGRGELRDDRAKLEELWNAANEAFAEGGPEDPSNVILAVRGDTAQFWDSPSKPALAVGLVKSALGRGGRPDGGDSGVVNL